MSHALLSPSASHRWLTCTPSARLEEAFPDTESESAKEGTLAHAIGEWKARQVFIEEVPKRAFNKKMKEFRADSMYQKEMEAYTDAYVDYIKEVAFAYPIKPVVMLEHQLDIGAYAPESFGTADCLIVAGTELHIIDLKYGRGVPVLADHNPQLMLYALGAMQEFDMLFAIDTLHLHIFQPRNKDGGGVFTIPASELLAWGESIREKSRLAFEGVGEFAPGEHCKFCRASTVCRAQAEYYLELCKKEFQMPPVLSNDEVGNILMQAIGLDAWINKLKDYALSQVLTGAQVKGWKAVEGRSSRQWADFDGAFSKLIESGVSEEILYQRTPLTLSQVEKELGVKTFGELVGDMVIKQAGKPTLVLESDKRQAITKASAKEDFI